MSPPTTYDAMLFLLPRFSNITRRVVEILPRMWELWSPNSSVHAYFPGMSDQDLVLGTELEPRQR